MSKARKLREALEAALVEDPDDLATHAAYADRLIDQGDPRGEFIQVQLALEDPSRPFEERKRLQQRERELLAAHEREWLGELASLLLGTHEEQRAMFAAELKAESRDWLDYGNVRIQFRYGWARGWLDRFECENTTVEMVRKVGRAPIARLLRAVAFRGDEGAGLFQYPDGPDLPDKDGWFRPCEILAHYPVLNNLRIFQYGQEIDLEEDEYQSGTQYERLSPLIEQMPRLEELQVFAHSYRDDEMWEDMHQYLALSTLTNLRVYRHYHGTTYALEPFATNPALGRLTHLLLIPHSFSRSFNPEWLGTEDWIGAERGPALHRDNVRGVLASPYLTSLTHLQLRCCDGGDATINDIVGSGILKRLKMLDLRHGHVTDEGAQRLASCPDATNLEVLDLVNNRLTDQGVAALEAAGIPVRADRQQTQPFNDEHILYYGDTE